MENKKYKFNKYKININTRNYLKVQNILDAFFFLEKRGKGKTGKKNNRIDVIPQLTIMKLKFLLTIFI